MGNIFSTSVFIQAGGLGGPSFSPSVSPLPLPAHSHPPSMKSAIFSLVSASHFEVSTFPNFLQSSAVSGGFSGNIFSTSVFIQAGGRGGPSFSPSVSPLPLPSHSHPP